ncbi:C39 family peptidase [Herbaspirillum sp. AP02]|uniref:C39 family peptidase n=1 Tax=unclassified Herbaspirillum TaxID=2624150 RepID=UPI0015D9C738|nr:MULTISPECIES: C39 family peptidase [unclassified Herbaspirillum]MBG7621155.1 C39 family peptidase [Herbaspirillum sp. AP02]NZD68884.1 C39 family peptidase [Herbaspirillum sp. AP21]
MKKPRSKIFSTLRTNALANIFSLANFFACSSAVSVESPAYSGKQNSPGSILPLSTHTAQLGISIQSWKRLRDAEVVKQDFDYSCSAASLATLLNGFYGQSLTEESLLKAMDKGNLKASFEDMQMVLPKFGFKAQGFAASYEQLSKLKAPVVVYLKHRKDDHFSVLRGINEDTVWLADPSLGNRTYSKAQFLEMWQTRSDKENADLSGKILAILPLSGELSTDADFFSRTARRQTMQAVEQLKFRVFP